MFRGINTNNNNLDIKIELWKNKNEILAEIPLEWCTEISYNFGEPTQLNLEIPKFIMRNNEKVNNSLFNKIKIRQQLIVEINGEKERFIITEQSFKLEKKKGIKSLTAYSFEKTLENKRISFSDTITRTLVKDELYIHDGLLDEVTKVSGWTIGYVDEDAKMVTEMANENIHVNLFENYTNNKIEEEGLIWEKDIITDVDSKYAVNIQIDYLRLKTYDESDKLLKTEQLSNQLKPLYTNIKHIKAYHHSETGNRYGIKYVITLVDDVEVEQVHTFTNIVNKKIIAENINLIYETGNIVEGTRAKFISIDGTNDNVLSFMKVLQEQFECVFKYDTMSKTINCYSKKNIGEDKPIELSYDTNVLSINITPSDEVPNCLIVEGNDGLSISDMNPYGGNTLYNYSWYVENDYLPNEVVVALEKYDKLLYAKQEEYEVLKNAISDLQSAKTKSDSEISSLEYRIKYYYNLLTGLIAGNDEGTQQEKVKGEINQLEEKLNECIATRISLQEQILLIEDDMINISEEIDKTKAVDEQGQLIFTSDYLEILSDIEYTSIYEDSYYSTSYSLYNNALKVFEDMIKPQVEFNIECGNLLKLIKNKIKNVIELGSFFMVDNEEIPELEDKVRFIGYKLIPIDGNKVKISNTSFTNKDFKNESLNFASNVGKKTTKSTNTIRTFKDVWEDAMLSNDYVSKLVDGGLDLATTQINSRSSRNLLDFSEYGSFWKDADNPTDGNQVYIGNSLVAISQNGFSSSEVAIMPEGVVAEVIIGKLLLGSKCEISTPDGLFVIGNNEDNSRIGTHIYDEVGRSRIFLGLERDALTGYQTAKFELKDANGREVVISENGIISHNQYQISDNLDSSHPMYTFIDIDEGTYEVRKVKLKLKLEKYRTFEKGTSSNQQQTSSSSGGFSIQASGGSKGSTTSTSTNQNAWNTQAEFVTQMEEHFTGETHIHQVNKSQFTHKHNVTVSVDTTHTHNVSQDPHSHTISPHNHPLEYGIFEGTMPSNISIYINGELYRSGINTDSEIDITPKMVIGKFNEIKITSSTNGRIVCNVFSKCFVGY